MGKVKVGDVVSYVGTHSQFIGCHDGKVLSVCTSGDSVEVKWPKMMEPVRHGSAALITTNRVQDKPEVRDDGVRKPSHYQVFEGVESIEIIARSMTISEFRGFCMGNVLKYRLRAGKKSELATMEKDLAKAGFYGELYEKHKDKCYDY